MKSRHLISTVIVGISLGLFAGDSNKFTLNTRSANFLIMSFDSKYCRGPYNASRNDKAYFELYKGVDRSYNQNENPGTNKE